MVSEPSEKAPEPVTVLNPVTVEHRNIQEEPSSTAKNDPQEEQEVTGSIH